MYVRVRVTPGSKREVFEKISDDTFRISVKEKPQASMANRRILELLATHLKIPTGKLRIVSGHHSPVKLISILE
jgi:uncharacterized protein YggU (UPF0235/DUF167 family)